MASHLRIVRRDDGDGDGDGGAAGEDDEPSASGLRALWMEFRMAEMSGADAAALAHALALQDIAIRRVKRLAARLKGKDGDRRLA